MTTARLSEAIREKLGWCPMTASTKGQANGGRETAIPPESPSDTGPVARRAARFSWGVVALAGLSWIIALAALPYLPETIPIHWNLYGEADGFAGRVTGAFAFSGIITLTVVLLFVLPRFGKKQEPFDDSRDIYAIVAFATVFLLLALQLVTLLASAGMDLPIALTFPVLFGFFFIVAGSLMPALRRNTTVGIRLPWTVCNDTVWRRTHEHGGPLFIIAGVLMVLGSAVAGAWAMPMMLVILVAVTLYITAWSYRLAKSSAAAAESPWR